MFDYKELRWRRTSLQAASVSELVSEGVDSRVVYDAHLGCRAVGRCATATFSGAVSDCCAEEDSRAQRGRSLCEKSKERMERFATEASTRTRYERNARR